MNDDFNTGGAVGALFELLTALNKYADDEKFESGNADQLAIESFAQGGSRLREMSDILGLFWAPPQEAKLGGDDTLVAGLMQLLIDLRNNLRAEAKKIAAKDDPTKKALFEQTDVIRKRLGELGVVLEDRPGGTSWRKA
jgi:cysteinyl-tRNA synthetase